LKEKLRELMSDRERRARLGAAALQRAMLYFSLKRMVSEYAQIYASIDEELGLT
jgi:glycosyltransferase involved in cell wall biosynthesis